MGPAKDHLMSLFEYVRWADHRQMDACRSVPSASYYKDYGFSFRTVHDTLVHMCAAQEIWLTRWESNGANSPARMLDRTDLPDLESVRVHWHALHARLGDFLHRQSTSSLSKRIEWTTTDGKFYSLPLGHLVQHCLDHSTYHRGQLNSLIRMAGGTPVRVMYYQYLIEAHVVK
jgi:uncharacterized damage-inducible protein DinB